MVKRKDPAVKRQQKAQTLIERTAKIMHVSEHEARQRLSTPLVQAVRINSLQGGARETLKAMRLLGWDGEQYDWFHDGYTIADGYEALRDSTLVTEGRLYIQNPSSWLPVVALDAQPGDRVLDVCAAPGGKASHIAAQTGNQIDLVVNDNSRARLAKLKANLVRLGVQADYTLHDATRLGNHFEPESFDRILLDAPCSGEGLINLDLPKTLDTWSVAHVRRLSDLQKKLLFQAWQLLKPNGTLVYSTCTMSPEENEAVVDALLRRASDARIKKLAMNLDAPMRAWNNRPFNGAIQNAGRVFPLNGGEAFFIAKLVKKQD